MTIEDYLTKLLQHAGVDPENLKLEIVEDETSVNAVVEVSPEDSGLLIGFHGDTLNSIQRMTRIVFQEYLQDKRFTLNINQYREQRAEKLKTMAIDIAQRVLETGETYEFSFLPPQERFVIHSVLSEMPEFESLETVSEGEGNQRYLTIRPKAA
ncbi:MAG: KH domain-containing protein [bacterium]|nr:KH domain-containing protein [bacterium]